MLEDSGFVGVEVGSPVDTFGGSGGEGNARVYDVYGFAFIAHRP